MFFVQLRIAPQNPKTPSSSCKSSKSGLRHQSLEGLLENLEALFGLGVTVLVRVEQLGEPPELMRSLVRPEGFLARGVKEAYR